MDRPSREIRAATRATPSPTAPPGRHPPVKQSEQTDHSDDARCDQQPVRRDQFISRRPPRAASDRHARHPVRGALHGRRDADASRCVGRRLDVFEERRAVPAQQRQRDHPPGTCQEHARRPPRGEPETYPPRPGQCDQGGEWQHRQGEGRVRGSHAGDPECGKRRRPAHPPRAPSQQGQDGPGQDGDNQRLRGDGSERRHHPWAQRVRDTGENARPPGAHGQSPAQCDDSGICKDQKEGAPETLDDPWRRAHDLAHCEEWPDRKEVSVRLVLQLSEVRLGIPQRQSPSEEVPGTLGQIELRVEGRRAGSLHEGK